MRGEPPVAASTTCTCISSPGTRATSRTRAAGSGAPPRTATPTNGADVAEMTPDEVPEDLTHLGRDALVRHLRNLPANRLATYEEKVRVVLAATLPAVRAERRS